MFIVSDDFARAMKNRPYVARITIDGADILQGEVIQEIYFRGGANSSENALLLGSAFSDSVEITMDQRLVDCQIAGRELFVELGIQMESGAEWIPMGRYTAGDPAANDGVLIVKALDDLGAKLDVDYEPMVEADFNSDTGVSSNAFLAALCARRGVNVDVSGLVPVQLKGAPEGFTERQIVGFISALYGGFAKMDRLGVLRICTYTKTATTITADDYYSDGLEKATYGFSPGWLKCRNEATDLNMFVGDFDAAQGINLQSIWMTQARLNSLWETLQAFTYQPVSELSFLGNPLIDPGDIIMLEDAAGELVSVPVMTITHEYDGGLITSVTSVGQAKTVDYEGPTRKAAFRQLGDMKKYVAYENKKLDQLELLKRLTKEWVDDGIYLTEDGRIGINASAILVGMLSSSDGKIQIDLNDGSSGPVFNTGISTNGVTVRGDVANAPVVFSVKAQTQEGIENPYIDMVIKSVNGQTIGRLVESFANNYQETYGVTFQLVGQQANTELRAFSNSDATGINMYDKGKVKASFITDCNNPTGAAISYIKGVDGINPGKKTLFSGSVEVGSAFTVLNTAYYDLFAVKLGDSTGVFGTTVLAYKSFDVIRGIGGWCGTATEQKEVFFLSVSFSGDTWTLVDAGSHRVPMAGGVSAGTRLQVKEVLGVI